MDVEEKCLGSWLSNQQHHYKKNNSGMKDKIRYDIWTHFLEDYKEYFITDDDIWIQKFEELKKDNICYGPYDIDDLFIIERTPEYSKLINGLIDEKSFIFSDDKLKVLKNPQQIFDISNNRDTPSALTRLLDWSRKSDNNGDGNQSGLVSRAIDSLLGLAL